MTVRMLLRLWLMSVRAVLVIQVSGAYAGHENSVEDLQWSPTEETVFASSSVDKTIRVWDTRERSKPMLTVQAHDTDVNVISWNQQVRVPGRSRVAGQQ